jgi:predicted ATPase
MDLELRPLNVLIGANGAGKSNLVSFFKMLNEMMAGHLQTFIATSGHAHSLLHFGPKVTPEIGARLEFSVGTRPATGAAYEFRLAFAAADQLIFADERLVSEDFLTGTAAGLGSGHVEARLRTAADSPNMPDRSAIVHFLEQCRVFHFHDTSDTARVRQYGYIEDNRRLRCDAGNLAAFLLRLRDENSSAYRRIVGTFRLIAPFFDEFILHEPATGSGNGPDVILNWREKGSDEVFGPHQLSDGTLRAIGLVTLLLQPERDLPELIVVDEPELGLHPYAVEVVASLFKKASHYTQVLVCTQSPTFLDQFDPEDIVVVDRNGKESQFIRPDPIQLESWLEEYSLGEVWEKNVIGGGPH